MKTQLSYVPWVLTVPIFLCLLSTPAASAGTDVNEFKVKREEVFEFAQKPVVTRKGDQITVTFESKGLCDVTIAVENNQGRILRHLASGVLGPRAPEPFQKDSKKQSIIWDGKDDQGAYVEDKNNLSLRVSLGLQPKLEKKVFGDPKRRIGFSPPIMVAAREGVYVFDSRGTDFLRLFDHEGNYVRTIYPFDADKLARIDGLKWHQPPISDKPGPDKFGCTLASLLTSGVSSLFHGIGDIKHGRGIAATAMAVSGTRIALAYNDLNRLSTDGTTGALPLKGGRTGARADIGSSYGTYKGEPVGPSSAALSPDGKTLYLTGYLWRSGGGGWVGGCLNGVLKLDYEKGIEPEVFAGKMTRDGHGKGDTEFAVPTSVACDPQGRIYVTDHWNDRIQVFTPDGRLARSIPATKPTKVMIDPRNGEIWVASYLCYGVPPDLAKQNPKAIANLKNTLTVFGPFDNPARKTEYALPVEAGDAWSMLEKGQPVGVEFDPWASPPAVWLAGRKLVLTAEWVGNYSGGRFSTRGTSDSWQTGGIQILELADGKLKKKRAFADDVVKSCLRATPPDHSSQRLYVNPKTGKLYIHEQRHPAKSFAQAVEIDPATDKKRLVNLPFSAEDMAFDLDGMAYLRTDTEVVRYDPTSWREIPWDYGEERPSVGFDGGGARVISALALPGNRPVCYNMGGMWVSPKGHIAVTCTTQDIEKPRTTSGDWKGSAPQTGKAWRPQVYPGMAVWEQIHVWDKHGKLIYEDALPGCWRLDGIAMDEKDDLYIAANATRLLDGKMYPNEMVGTLFKVTPGKSKVVSSNSPILPLPKESQPNRPPDLRTSKMGNAWVEGQPAHWFYGGVGYGGFNTAHSGGGCACWHSRCTLDLYARSFAPESENYSVAVLDRNGNLILRVGQYGNEDSLGPDSRLPLPGDGVGLMYPMYVATHSDRRLFIQDAGNARILSVKLDYAMNETIALKDVPDSAEKK